MDAVLNALSEAHMMASQIDIIASVTSTGLALPGLSAMLMRRIPFKRDTQRTDIVGMGCNAGLSGLRSLSMMLQSLARSRNRSCFGLLLCFETNSTMFVSGDTTGNGIVNSLFGDGAVALILEATPDDKDITPSIGSQPSHVPTPPSPSIWLSDFESYTLPE